MLRKRSSRAHVSGDVVDNAWKLHDTLVDWTGKVDNKAAFTLTLESAVVASLIAAFGGDLVSLGSNVFIDTSFWVGVFTLSGAIATVVLAVIPRLRGSKTNQEYQRNFIYFGHLRFWTEKDLVEALSQRDLLPVLAKQNIAMSKVAWKKHRYVQVSLWLAMCGFALVVPAIVVGMVHI